MIKSFLIAGTLAGAISAPAMAGGLEGSYAGAGVAVGIDGAETAASVSGRYEIPSAPVSVRPQLTIGDNFGGNAALTADLGVAKDLNLYAGGGVGFGAGTALNGDDDTVGFAVVGAEGAIAENVVLFADVKFGLGGETSYVPTVGIGYRF
jgi:hypothetical protein